MISSASPARVETQLLTDLGIRDSLNVSPFLRIAAAVPGGTFDTCGQFRQGVARLQVVWMNPADPHQS